MSSNVRTLTKARAEAIYARRREKSYREIEALFSYIDPSLQLTKITPWALRQAKTWIPIPPSPPRIDWDWDEEFKRFRRRPKRTEVAIWLNGTFLCGLSLGRVSKHRVVATIHLIEGNPNLPAIMRRKVGKIVTMFLQSYALLCGCSTMVVDSPDPNLLGFYGSLGFTQQTLLHGEVVRLSQPVTTQLPFDPLI